MESSAIKPKYENGRWQYIQDIACLVFTTGDTNYIVFAADDYYYKENKDRLRITKYLSDLPETDNWTRLIVSDHFIKSVIEFQNFLPEGVVRLNYNHIKALGESYEKEEELLNYCRTECFTFDYSARVDELMATNNFDEAEKEIKKYIKYEKVLDTAYFDLAKIYAYRKDIDKTVRHLERRSYDDFVNLIISKEFEPVKHTPEFVVYIDQCIKYAGEHKLVRFWQGRKEYASVVRVYIQRHWLDSKALCVSDDGSEEECE
uniref:Tetratricopeptide repeat protein n=1 Tax=viral metagenome TaxID=1070528 RepID=A0A6C0EB70_9ZZZZ